MYVCMQVVLYESISKDMVKSEQEMPQTELKGGSTSQHPHIFQVCMVANFVQTSSKFCSNFK